MPNGFLGRRRNPLDLFGGGTMPYLGAPGGYGGAAAGAAPVPSKTALQRYQESLEGRPEREEPVPISRKRRLGAALAAFAARFGGGPGAGLAVGQQITGAPRRAQEAEYQRGLEKWEADRREAELAYTLKGEESRRGQYAEEAKRLAAGEAREATEFASPAAAAERMAPPGAAGTIKTAQGIMQWNPETRRFDIPAGQAPPKEAKRVGSPFAAEVYGTPEEKAAAGEYQKGQLEKTVEAEQRGFERFQGRLTSQEQVKMRTEVRKLADVARKAETLSRKMQDILSEVEQTGTISGPQSMVLLSNHIAMTFGAVKGARMGRDMIMEHLRARSMPQGMEALARRILQGGNLSMKQAEEFVELARIRRFREWQSVVETANARGVDVGMIGVPTEIQGAVLGTQGIEIREGTIQRNKKTGEQRIRRNGKWEPYQGPVQ